MTSTEDAALLSALEAQQRELDYLLGRLETVRATLLPPPASFWRGAAGRAYENQRSSLATVVDEGITTVSDAWATTTLAVQQVMSRV